MNTMPYKKTAFIDGVWTSTHGNSFTSINPSNGKVIWEGNSASNEDIARAIHSGREAFEAWSNLHLSERQKYLSAFGELLIEHKNELAEVISDEVGKPRWEALIEVQSAINKISISVSAYNQRCQPLSADAALARFKPHGVVVVFGTFNSPLHVSNGHIIPALLAGNTVILKPSELAPLTAQKTIEFWNQTGIRSGVINLIQGGRHVGETLVSHPDINGIFFTGSVSTGIAINKAVAGDLNKIVTLELGGNNPLVIHDIKDFRAAAHTVIQSAYITSGQRCTCARRLIITNSKNRDNFLEELIRQIKLIRVGSVDKVPEPFMGPVISLETAERLLQIQKGWLAQGAIALVPLKQISPNSAFVSPGLIDVSTISRREDIEVFGPLLQCIRVNTLEDAINEANNTKYGLSSAIICDRKEDYELFYKKIRAGVINWNRQTTGASSGVPFGGIGVSGNHRPTAYFAADYCSYPVSSIEITSISLPKELPSGISLD
jgi:succinylglutamic semialdehyde dehydrogenase